MEKYTVTFLPDRSIVEVDKGTTVLAAAISARIPINTTCGGDGVCGKCKVVIRKGQVHSEPTGLITSDEKERGFCLACQSLVESDLEVEVPAESRFDLSLLSKEELDARLHGLYSGAEDVLQEKKQLFDESSFSYAPLISKFYLELHKPDFEDKLSDLDRIYRAIEDRIGQTSVVSHISNLRRLGELLRSSDWKVTVTLLRKSDTAELILIEPGDKSENNYCFVFDIGTTTVTGQLVDLNTKTILGTKAAFNRQATFGTDIISRIIYSQAPDGLKRLHEAVIDLVNEMIESLAQENNVDLNDCSGISIAGNTTMMHLLLCIDPKYIRQEPYIPTINSIPALKAVEAGIKINPCGLLFCAPGVASYLGGDITAGVLACGIQRSKDVSLLIDIGTNGEIVLGNSDWMIGCAASAGPAFEGSGMSCGMRAVKGAIQKADISCDYEHVNITTIGNLKPRGICGSGYIDLVCSLLNRGIVDKNGKINKDLGSRRIRQGNGGAEFVVAFSDESGIDCDIVITDCDLDNLKRAKAAIYSAAAILLKHMDMSWGDVKNFYIAGGFGTALDIHSAIQIGLIPDLNEERFVFMGNSSLSGARQIIFSVGAANAAEDIAKNITYFELSTDAGYMDEYMAALFFPHTDIARFPNVKFNR